MDTKEEKMRSHDMDMLNGPLAGKIFLFSLPLALTSILQQLFNSADLAVVGRFSSSTALAAVGDNSAPINLIVSLFVGLSLGVNVVIGMLIGQGKKEKIREAVSTIYLVAILSGLILLPTGELVARPLLSAMGTPEDVMGLALLYLRIYFFATPFIMIYNFGSAILRARGDSARPLIALAVSGVINIGLNLFFVIGFHMSVDGVAYATVISNIISSVLVTVFLIREKGEFHLSLRHLKIHREYLSTLFRIGIPAGLQGMVFCISNIIIQSARNSLGADAMAASAAAFTIEINVYCIINSFGQAATTFVSQNYGARNIRRCRSVMWWCLGLNAFFMGLMALFIYWQAIPMLGFFSSDPLVIELGNTRIMYVVYTQFINILIEIRPLFHFPKTASAHVSNI